MPFLAVVAVMRHVERMRQVSDPRFRDLRKNFLYIIANEIILQASILSNREKNVNQIAKTEI